MAAVSCSGESSAKLILDENGALLLLGYSKRGEMPVGRLAVQPEGLVGYIGDIAMAPLMYVLSGSWLSGKYERPQRTHLWNITRLSASDVKYLDREQMVCCEGVKGAMRRITPLFHLQLLGGWRDYVVVEPECRKSP